MITKYKTSGTLLVSLVGDVVGKGLLVINYIIIVYVQNSVI